jgi:hypothetical protein
MEDAEARGSPPWLCGHRAALRLIGIQKLMMLSTFYLTTAGFARLWLLTIGTAGTSHNVKWGCHRIRFAGPGTPIGASRPRPKGLGQT